MLLKNVYSMDLLQQIQQHKYENAVCKLNMMILQALKFKKTILQ